MIRYSITSPFKLSLARRLAWQSAHSRPPFPTTIRVNTCDDAVGHDDWDTRIFATSHTPESESKRNQSLVCSLVGVFDHHNVVELECAHGIVVEGVRDKEWADAERGRGHWCRRILDVNDVLA
jgi:hypothetical protein